MGVVGRVGVCAVVGAALLVPLFVTESSASTRSALLDVLAARVTISRDGAVEVVAREGIIRSGDTVTTDDGGRAIVTYPDGSTVLLEESSQLTVEFVRTTAGDHLVRMQQTLGRIWYAVTKTIASNSRYEVRSPAMASVIRAGSGAYVAVAGGEATLLVTAGAIETGADAAAITIPAGTSAIVTLTAPAVSLRSVPVLAPSPAPSAAPTSAPVVTASKTHAPVATNVSSWDVKVASSWTTAASPSASATPSPVLRTTTSGTSTSSPKATPSQPSPAPARKATTASDRGGAKDAPAPSQSKGDKR